MTNRTVPGVRKHTFSVLTDDPTRGGSGSKKNTPDQYVLNRTDTARLWNLYHEELGIRLGSEEFKGRLFHLPFEVTLGGVKSTQLKLKDNVRDMIVKKYWMPWIAEIHDWLKMFGIAPYYFKPIIIYDYQNTTPFPSNTSNNSDGGGKNNSTKVNNEFIHFVPVVPPFGSGCIKTYLDHNIDQQFVWTWNDKIGSRYAGKDDNRMYWAIQHKPTMFGEYTCILKSALIPWIHTRTILQTNMNVAQARSNRMHVVESHPQISNTNSLALEQLQGSDLSNVYPGTYVPSSMPYTSLDAVDAREARINRERMGDSRTGREDVGLPSYTPGHSDYISPYAVEQASLVVYRKNHPDPSRDRLMENKVNILQKRLPSNTLKLAPYEKYVNSNLPEETKINILDLLERTDKIFAALADFPLDTIMNQNYSSVSKGESSKEFTIGRLRSQSKAYSEIIKTAWKEAYAPLFIKGKNDAEKIVKHTYGRKPNEEEWAWIDKQLDISIKFPRTPFIEFTELVEYYNHGIIGEEQFYKFSIDLIGLPADEKVPKDLMKKLKQQYDPEYQHKQQVRWKKEEIKEGIDIDNTASNNSETGGSAPSPVVTTSKPTASTTKSGNNSGGGGGSKDSKKRKRNSSSAGKEKKRKKK